MKKFLFIISALCSVYALAQDTTLAYPGWGRLILAEFMSPAELKDTIRTQVTYQQGNPVVMRQLNADGTLERTIRNLYDDMGNHISRKVYDAKNTLRLETLFRHNPDEIALFRTVFGETFIPENPNFMIHREYNEFGREQLYEILGVQGRVIYSRSTSYREDRRKDTEILQDHLNDRLLARRRYKYDDAEQRTILEEFDGHGKLVQRVVLFDNHDILEE